MMRLLLPLIALAAVPVAAETPAAPKSASAVLADPTGKPIGRAMLSETPHGLHVVVSATGLKPGVHGVHVHTVGTCTAPDFASAGPHWNPTAKQHGTANPQGSHLGDLPNLIVDPNGGGMIDAVIHGATLTGGTNPVLDADGAAVVIHAAADDYKTDPSGASGGRIACGVLAAS